MGVYVCGGDFKQSTMNIYNPDFSELPDGEVKKLLEEKAKHPVITFYSDEVVKVKQIAEAEYIATARNESGKLVEQVRFFTDGRKVDPPFNLLRCGGDLE